MRRIIILNKYCAVEEKKQQLIAKKLENIPSYITMCNIFEKKKL